MNQIQRVRTPTGILPLVRQTAEKLLREGVISGALDGDLHAADAATVKAAIMASAVCDFCSAPGASHYYDVPDFGITTDARYGTNYSPMVGTSTGGWIACDECDVLVKAGKRKQLVDRAINTMAFPKFTRTAIEEMYEKFWQGMDDRNTATGVGKAIGDFIEDRLTGDYIVKPQFSARDKRIEAMKRITGLTAAQAEALTKGELDRDAVVKLVAWRKGVGGTLDPRDIADLLGGAGPKKPLADIAPHWQRALDMKFAALGNVHAALSNESVAFPDAIDLKDPAAVMRKINQARVQKELRDLGFGSDEKLLRAADAYSFNGETIAAIRQAAAGVPHDTPLSAIETPNTGAGWFWFADPLPVTASPVVSDQVHALLWGWVEQKHRLHEVTFDDELFASAPRDAHERLAEVLLSYQQAGGAAMSPKQLSELGTLLRTLGVSQEMLDRKTKAAGYTTEPAIMFSAYVVDEKGKYVKAGTPGPSTRWHWPLSMSFHDMLAYNRESHREEYGPGGDSAGKPHLVGEDETLRAVAELSLFFVMACLWFRQTVPVLTREAGHVERHARKRLQREHKLDAPPSVQVIALRKSARVPVEHVTGAQAASAREWHCRWIVKGHPRLQPCGPGRKDKKLIWIEAFKKGPDDKPLRVRERVYAVIK